MFRSHHNLVEDFFSDARGHVLIEDFCSFVEENRSFEPFAGVTRSFFASGPQFGPLEESGARRTHARHTWPRREQARTCRLIECCCSCCISVAQRRTKTKLC